MDVKYSPWLLGIFVQYDSGLEKKIVGVEKFQSGTFAESQHFIPQIRPHVPETMITKTKWMDGRVSVVKHEWFVGWFTFRRSAVCKVPSIHTIHHWKCTLRTKEKQTSVSTYAAWAGLATNLVIFPPKSFESLESSSFSMDTTFLRFDPIWSLSWKREGKTNLSMTSERCERDE